MIESAARKAFDAFYFEKDNQGRSGVGKMYESNRNWKSFLAIGRMCVDKGWDAGAYVESTYRCMAANGGIVLPCNLATQAAAEFYSKEQYRQSGKPEEIWNHVEMLIAGCVVEGATEKQVLINPMISIPAWVRVLYPEELDDDIVSIYGDRAMSEISAGQGVLEFARVKNRRSLERLISITGFDRSGIGSTT